MTDDTNIPREPRSVSFKTSFGNTVQIQQPQRGVPSNRVVPPTAHGTGGFHPNSAGPSQERQDASGKFMVVWRPTRGPGSDAYVELDACFIRGLPEDPSLETDGTARMIIALLTEIVTLRARVDRLEAKKDE